jgi:hypothetical protein
MVFFLLLRTALVERDGCSPDEGGCARRDVREGGKRQNGERGEEQDEEAAPAQGDMTQRYAGVYPRHKSTSVNRGGRRKSPVAPYHAYL